MPTFAKAERLSARKEIDHLFTHGASFAAHPLRIIYTQATPLSGAVAAILTSVPKKMLKLAVDRNRVKRLIRETYRLHAAPLQTALRSHKKSLLIAFVYTARRPCPYDTMEKAMKQALETLLLQEILPHRTESID